MEKPKKKKMKLFYVLLNPHSDTLFPLFSVEISFVAAKLKVLAF